MDALSIKGLTKNYSKFKLSNIDMVIPQGCIMGLIGENGAGKSTLIKSILDLVNRESGEIEFYGQKLDRNSCDLREDIGVVFDTLHFHETLDPKKIGKISSYTFKNWDNKVYEENLKKFGLDGKMKIKEMSKGMKMKLGIAIALSHKAKLLILDEPTAGLDPVAREDLLDLFLEFMQDETHSILISSHITSDLEKVADYITFIHEGKLLMSKSKDELLYDYRIVRCGESDYIELKEEQGAVWRRQDYQYEVLLPNGKELESKYTSCNFERPTIDEIMLMYIRGERK